MRRIWLLLAFAAALVLWLWRSPRGEAPSNATPSTNSSTAPGYVATGAELIDTDADGQPQYSLRATQISQPAPTADIELTEPQFVYRGETVWTLTAARGVLPPAAQQIELLGDVVARGVRAGSVPLQLRTASVSVDMQARTADSSDAVAMEWGRNRLWASGLHADLKTDELRLESPVHGEVARLEQ
jgi:LPS export ABC transporter protein LptC